MVRALLQVLFWIGGFLIFWAMIGYKFSLRLLKRLYPNASLIKDYSYKPTVSVMIVAHNEEKVIFNKLKNIIDNDYPKDKIEYIVASDYSTDQTNEIVENFISEHKNHKIQLYQAKEHKGKTNVQNEAQKITGGEILVMTDANAMFCPDSISELVSAFTEESIVYVTGRLIYSNVGENQTAFSESLYWEGDLFQREIESNIKTITAGNGAIYACRNKRYHDFPAIKCHDSGMPYYYGKKGLRCLYNPQAVAYEKAGETNEDEFKRKVRMNRGILSHIWDGIKCLNPLKNGWFSYFYFGHRTCRYLLWLSHIIVFFSNILLFPVHWFYRVTLVMQGIFYITGGIGLLMKSKNRVMGMVSYYCMTVLAQFCGVINCLTGRSKATWEKAESTR